MMICSGFGGTLFCGNPMCLVSGCWGSKLAGPKLRNIHKILRESPNDWWIVRNPDWKSNVSVEWTIDFIQLVYQPTFALTTHWDWNKTTGLHMCTDPTHPNHCFQRSRTIKVAASSGSLQSPFHNCYRLCDAAAAARNCCSANCVLLGLCLV